METRTYVNPARMTKHFDVSLPQDELAHMVHHEIAERVVEKVATAVSDYIIHNHFQEIIKGIDIQAISNIAVAEAGAKINETLSRKLPDKVMVIEKTRERLSRLDLLRGLE